MPRVQCSTPTSGRLRMLKARSHWVTVGKIHFVGARRADRTRDYLTSPGSSEAQAEHPRHLRHDIGYWNVGAYNSYVLGYKTPSVDRSGHQRGGSFADEAVLQSLQRPGK